MTCKGILPHSSIKTSSSSLRDVGTRMAGATVTEIAQLLGISRGTVSKVMAAYEKEVKTSSANHKSDRSSSLSERDRRTLNCIVRKIHKITASKITA